MKIEVIKEKVLKDEIMSRINSDIVSIGDIEIEYMFSDKIPEKTKEVFQNVIGLPIPDKVSPKKAFSILGMYKKAAETGLSEKNKTLEKLQETENALEEFKKELIHSITIGE